MDRMATITRYQPNAEQIAEQHSFVDPKYLDYISVRQASRSERTYKLCGVLTEEGQKQYVTGSDYIDLRTTDFQSSKEAREFARAYYKGITIQTN